VLFVFRFPFREERFLERQSFVYLFPVQKKVSSGLILVFSSLLDAPRIGVAACLPDRPPSPSQIWSFLRKNTLALAVVLATIANFSCWGGFFS